MLANISSALCTVLFVAIAVFAYDAKSLFQWHPIFFGFGFLMCTITAINVMQSKVAPASKLTRKTKGQLHGVLQFIGVVCMVLGFVAIYLSKEERKKEHLTTWHAWAGVAALDWMVLNVLGGLWNTLNVTKLRLNWVWSDKLHRLSGRLSAVLGMVAFMLGLYSHWAQRTLGPQWQMGLSALAAAIGLILVQPLLTGKPAKKAA